MTTLSVKEYQNLVVVIATQKIRDSLHRFEMILAVKVDATHTNGKSKHQILNFTEYRLCFSWTGRSNFCYGTGSLTCTGWSSQPDWTQPFHDYTNASPGHCRYSWMIQSRPYSYPSRFKVCCVCFKETLGSFQCQGTRRSCSG